MPEQAGSCRLTCMNNRVPGPNTTRCCCSRVKVDGAESFTDSARFVSQPTTGRGSSSLYTFLSSLLFLDTLLCALGGLNGRGMPS